MREVEVTRFVAASPAEVTRALTPVALVRAEESFDVREVTDADGGTVVTAGRSGVELRLRFETVDGGLAYEQLDGPLSTLRTTVTARPKDEGTELSARSAVDTGGPAVLDRLAAWKRRGELRRALVGIADRR